MLACCAMLEAEGAAGCQPSSVAKLPDTVHRELRHTAPRCLEYIYIDYSIRVYMLVPRLKPGKRLVPGCNVNGSGGSNLLIFPHYLLGSRINAFFTLVCKDPLAVFALASTTN